MSIKAKIGGAIATGALMAATLMPSAALASTNVTVRNNGFGSDNIVSVWNKKFSNVQQKNKTNVNSIIGISSNTGGNKSSFNTRGSNSITTGNTTTTVGIGVTGNSNTNTSDPCGCEDSDTNITIRGNGAFSDNIVSVGNFSVNSVSQTNNTTVNTVIFSSSNTGGNSSSFNTGGNNTIDTGNTTTTVGVAVEGGTNSN